MFAPAAGRHGLWPWRNMPLYDRDVAPHGRRTGDYGFAWGSMGKRKRMKFEKWLNQLDNFTRSFSRSLEWFGVVGLLLMFLVNFIDVVGAKLFLRPFPGSVEIISFFQIVAIAPAIAYTLILGRHIRVEFIIDRFPKGIRATLSSISSFFSLALFIFIVWQSYLYGQSLQKAGEIGSTSHMPFYPFAYLIAFCSIPVCLVFLIEVVKSVAEAFNHESS
jgi:TRAP-type C4-dicarboxylate transport system permease small subunit